MLEILGWYSDVSASCSFSSHLYSVDFAATLIRSPDPGAEFSDMAQRALLVEWLVEHAPQLFKGAA